MRRLKYHEQKLLKKVDLYSWKTEKNHREVQVMRRYHIQNRDDYEKYFHAKLQIGTIHSAAALPSSLPSLSSSRATIPRASRPPNSCFANCINASG